MWRDTVAPQLRLVEAVLGLVVARILVLVVPLRRLAPHLGVEVRGEPLLASRADRGSAGAVADAVRRVAPRMPFRAACYEQALTARMMLGRRRAPGTLWLGARRVGDVGLEGHAWVTSGAAWVVGGEEAPPHAVLVGFAWPR